MKPIICLLVATVAAALAAPAYAQIDCTDWNTKSFFEVAEVSDVTRCLQAGADLKARAEDGRTPLHLAANSGDGEALTALLEAGADAEARDLRGQTPLHSAANGGHAETVTALLEAVVEMEARDIDGMSPLHRAARNGRVAAVTTLTRGGSGC